MDNIFVHILSIAVYHYIITIIIIIVFIAVVAAADDFQYILPLHRSFV